MTTEKLVKRAERMVTRKQAGGLMMIQKLQAQRSPERTVTLAIPVALDRALELVAARRGWTKKKVVAWALTGRRDIRGEIHLDAKAREYAEGPLITKAQAIKTRREWMQNGGGK